MENNPMTKYISIGVTVILVVSALLLGYWIMSKINSADTSPVNTKSELKIDDTSYKKINESKDYGSEVKVEEPGYGRVNPFSPYK